MHITNTAKGVDYVLTVDVAHVRKKKARSGTSKRRKEIEKLKDQINKE